MNYRHAFHAGNFADVVKHVLLVGLVEYLKRKEAPFRVLDTHAGRGLYDLSGPEARRTGEHRDGIDRLLAAPPPTAALVRAYRDLVAADAKGGTYPGSPVILRRLLRRQDRLSAYELHPADAAALAARFAGDVQVRVAALDGWLALGAHVPPKERRGLVLVDPPFERPDEVEAIAAGLLRAHRRWPGGTYAVWYPIKRLPDRDRLLAALAGTGIPDILAAEFLREAPAADDRLVGSGLALVNPPFTFAAEASEAMANLEQVLGKSGAAVSRVIAISPERS